MNNMPTSHFNHICGNRIHKSSIMACENYRTTIRAQCAGKCLNSFNIKVVTGLIEHKHVVSPEQ